MPIRNYGVLKARVVKGRAEHRGMTPHFDVLASADGTLFRIAINTRSTDRQRPDLLYACDERFEHPLTKGLTALEDGFHPLPFAAGGGLDYVRDRLMTRERMRVMPADLPGPDNDLNEMLERWVDVAASDETARVYAYGSRWGPDGEHDPIFGFQPGNGVHDVHMNQGNPGRHLHENGIRQDGALFFHLPADNRWVAIFLAFQHQIWHTDERGNPLGVRDAQPFPGEHR
jgi:uncharacterized protein YukJ